MQKKNFIVKGWTQLIKRYDLLKTSLLLTLAIVGLAILYTVLLLPETERYYPLSFKDLPAGKWQQLRPLELYGITNDSSGLTIVHEKELQQNYLRFNIFSGPDEYAGCIIPINRGLPGSSLLTIAWRSRGTTPTILLDIMDGSATDETHKYLGENYYSELQEPGVTWQRAVLSLKSLELNNYQVAGAPIDSVFDFNVIRRVSLTFYPNSSIELDIKEIFFSWETGKWQLMICLLLLLIPGWLLLVRTRDNFELSDYSPRLVYILIVFSFIAGALKSTTLLLGPPILVSYAVIIILVLVDEIKIAVLPNRFWNMRYVCIFLLVWVVGPPPGIASICILFIASLVPVVLFSSRIEFWSVIVVTISLYFVNTPSEIGVTSKTGMLILFLSGSIAVIFREAVNQNRGEYKVRFAIEQYESLFRKTSDAIFITDTMGRIEAVNRQSESLTGYSIRELKCKNIGDITCRADNSLVAQEPDSITDEPAQYDMIFINKSGEHKTALVRTEPLFTDGKITGLRSLATDITERKVSEERLKDYAALLEEKNKELDELNSQLRGSESKLKELNAQKDKFYSIISHDLKNPFNAILGFSDMLRNESHTLEPGDIALYASSINSSAKHMLRLLENLLSWAMLQTDRVHFKYEKISVLELCREISGMLSGLGLKKHIYIDNNINDAGLFIYADYNSISSILQNLITNAVKFTPAGGRIILEAEETGEYVNVRVKDTGVGMTRDEVEHIFRIDIRHSSEGTESEKGTGLGLIICKEMIERNRGKITVSSVKGEGTVFTVSLPKYISEKDSEIIPV